MPRNLIFGRAVTSLSLQTVYITNGIIFGLELEVVGFVNIYGK